MGEFESLLGRSGLLPHGYCFQWSPGLLWAMAGSDVMIALAYFSIPAAIHHFVRHRPHQPLGGVPWLFVAFIAACGMTHVMDVWTIWRPEYELHAATKVLTAAVSVLTAITLWRLMPQALAIPTVAELRAALGALQAEVDRRRSAEDLLSDLEQALAASLATSGAAFIATDPAGRVTRMNAVAERVTGWAQAEAAGQPLQRVFRQPDDSAALLPPDGVQALQDDAAGGPFVGTVATVCLGRDGRATPVELSATQSRLPDGRARGLNLVFRDMSRLSRAEADMRRLVAVVESSIDAIIVSQLDGTVTAWNAAAERLFGWTASEIVGQPKQRLVPPEREAEELQVLAEVSAGRFRPPFDTVRLARDGRRIEVQVSISPVRDAQGRVVAASKVARDLTHQRRIEQALRANEQRLRFALEAAQLGDWELDIAQGSLHGSSSFARCLGRSEPPGGWSLAALAEAIHPEDRDAVRGTLQTALEQRQRWHAEFRMLGDDGRERWLRLDGACREEAGLSPRMTGIASDVTDVRQAELARAAVLRLGEENLRILEASRAKSLFLANMSHELRTPLNAVIGFADLLRSGVAANEPARQQTYLGYIADSGRHLLQIINDVLDLSKVEAGKLDFQPAAVDLQQLFDQAVAALAHPAALKRLEVTAHIEPGLRELWLDRARLLQVLLNFLSNAVKFTPEGGHIELVARGEGPRLFRMEVRDSGIGIDEADQARLFVEFQQLDSGYAKRHQGTGLGLALTRRLVQAQGGRVGVYSRPGEGSMFYAVLPRRHGAGDGVAPRMLVAQADHAVRDGLARGAAQAGVVPDTADSAAEVVRLARTTRYDIASLDLRLRDGPGLAAWDELQAQTPRAAAAVRSLTLSTPLGATVSFMIDGLMAKPLRPDELLALMAPLRAQLQDGVVLVVDDDPLACELMRSALQPLGVRCVTRQDGAQALADFDRIAPVAVVLDLMMPGLDGFQVLDRLRRHERWHETPVFIWTAMTLTADELERLSQSAQSIVAKGGGRVDAVLEALVRWARQQVRERAS